MIYFSVFSKNYKCLVYLFLFVVVVGCTKSEKNIIYKSTDKKEIVIKNKWLADPNNFDKKEYQTKFKNYYQNGIKTKNYIQCCEALYSAVMIMNSKGYFDNSYMIILDDFLKKHDKKISADYYCTLYFFLGVYDFNNMKYVESEVIFKKAKSVKPYNYHTYLYFGNIYYYISYCYFFSSDYVKALEENQKSSFYFGKTDNYEGSANCYQQKADIYIGVNNFDEALKAIDKSIELCKKSKNTRVNLFTYMHTKQSYLIANDPIEAQKYIDTLTDFVKKNKINSTIDLYSYNLDKFSVFLYEKNKIELKKIMPIIKSQVIEMNNEYHNDFLHSLEADYDLLIYKKIKNKEKILKSIINNKKIKNDIIVKSLLILLKQDAMFNNDLKLFLEYDTEIKKIEKGEETQAYRFKVKTFEKKIDSEKKEKKIAQQQTQISKNEIHILILSFVIIFIVFTIVLYFARKRKLEAKEKTKRQEQFTFQLLQNTEDERSRIANELHDSVNHDLLNIKNNIINGKTILVNDVSNIIEEVRNISRNLHPAMFEVMGLEASIESLCEKISEFGLFTTCDIDYSQKLTKNKELQLYRIIQEALNNTLKHGKANAAKVILKSENNFLYLEVKDNGSGFDVNAQLKNPKSFGLQSIMQRAKAIAAKINIDSTTKGTIILLKIPI
jgi:two-component system, NarL family, sensor kinase